MVSRSVRNINLYRAEKPMIIITNLCVLLCQVNNSNVFYILYYSLGFLLLTHVIPFFLIASRDKDVIDALHEAHETLDTMFVDQKLAPSSTGLTTSGPSDASLAERVNSKVIPDTSAVQHGQSSCVVFFNRTELY